MWSILPNSNEACIIAVQCSHQSCMVAPVISVIVGPTTDVNPSVLEVLEVDICELYVDRQLLSNCVFQMHCEDQFKSFYFVSFIFVLPRLLFFHGKWHLCCVERGVMRTSYLNWTIFPALLFMLLRLVYKLHFLVNL